MAAIPHMDCGFVTNCIGWQPTKVGANYRFAVSSLNLFDSNFVRVMEYNPAPANKTDSPLSCKAIISTKLPISSINFSPTPGENRMILSAGRDLTFINLDDPDGSPSCLVEDTDYARLVEKNAKNLVLSTNDAVSSLPRSPEEDMRRLQYADFSRLMHSGTVTTNVRVKKAVSPATDELCLRPHEGMITDARWCRSRKDSMYVGFSSGVVVHYNLERCAAEITAAVHDVAVTCVDDMDETKILSSSVDGSVRLFDMRDTSTSTILFESAGAPIHRITHNKLSPYQIALASDGEPAAVIDSRKPNVTLARLDEGPSEGMINDIQWCPEDARSLLTTTTRGYVNIWVVDGEETARMMEYVTPSSVSVHAGRWYEKSHVAISTGTAVEMLVV